MNGTQPFPGDLGRDTGTALSMLLGMPSVNGNSLLGWPSGHHGVGWETGVMTVERQHVGLEEGSCRETWGLFPRALVMAGLPHLCLSLDSTGTFPFSTCGRKSGRLGFCPVKVFRASISPLGGPGREGCAPIPL